MVFSKATRELSLEEDLIMIRAALGFFVLAIIAYFLGAGGVAGLSMEIGRIIVMVFLVLAGISFLGALFTGRNSPRLP